MEEKERRQYDRVRGLYYIKFSSAGDHPIWDIAPIRNISKGGILFYASNYYKPGSEMNIVIYHPSGSPDDVCKATVIRCDKTEKGADLYAVVVDIAHFDEETKTALYKAIEAFLRSEGDR